MAIHNSNMLNVHSPSVDRDAKAEDLASCFAGALIQLYNMISADTKHESLEINRETYVSAGAQSNATEMEVLDQSLFSFLT